MKYWKIIFICILLMVWYLSMKEFYFAALGPDVSFKLDSNYRLYGWPGFIAENDSDKPILADQDCGSIDKFAITEKYIIAKAKGGWLAINRITHQAWGCYETIHDLENSVGGKFGVLDLVEEFPKSYIYVNPKTRIVQIIMSLVFVGIILGIILFPVKSKR